MLSPKIRYRSSDPSIYLVGPMGSGKSTVGRSLARRLRADFIDLDREIEERAGKSISQLFECDGQKYFRDYEASVLKELASKSGLVVATGGGTILRQANRQCMRNGVVVYLHATVEQQYERIKNSTHRPLLNSTDPKETLSVLFKERDPLYRAESDIVMYTDNQSTHDVINRIDQKIMSL